MCGKSAARPPLNGPKCLNLLGSFDGLEVLENPRVGSSILSLGTTKPRFLRGFCVSGVAAPSALSPLNPGVFELSVANALQSVWPIATARRRSRSSMGMRP